MATLFLTIPTLLSRYLTYKSDSFNVSQGYKSIGDSFSTRPVKEGQGEREGRFVGLNRTECGMHSHLHKIAVLKEEAQVRDTPHYF